MTIDVNNPEVVQAIKDAGFVSSEQVDILVKESNQALEKNKNDILDQLKATKSKLDGIDVDAYRQLSEDPRFTRIMSDGLDSYERSLGGELQERLQVQQSDFMIKEQSLLQELEKEKQNAEKLMGSVKSSEIKRKLVMAMAHNELIDPLAIPDIERDATEQLDLDSQGNIVVKNADGTYRQTADGAMNEKDWLSEMMQSKPYRFKGASGGGNHIVNGVVVADLDKLSPQEKIRLARQQGRR